MRLAPKVIFLVRDSDGFGPAIADALRASPDSKFTRETSSFELSLEKYGISDRKASGDLIEFVDPHGSPQVSVLLLPNYGPPIAACAVKEVLALISSEETSSHPTIILPFVMKTLKFNQEWVNPASSEHKVMLYGAEIGGTTETIQAIIAKTATPPPSMQIHCESLACFIQMVRVLNLPTLLIASGAQHQSKRSADQELEALYEVGQFLANHLGLCFSKERLQQKEIEKPRDVQEPWRALYG